MLSFGRLRERWATLVHVVVWYDGEMILFHGTTSPLAQFQSRAPERTDGDADTEVVYGFARGLGTFFSAHPRIAAHFVLKAEVIDAGYDSHQGSASLCENPWRFDAEPFLQGAQVLACEVSDAQRWKTVSVEDWVGMVAEQDDGFFVELRERLDQEGYHGVMIPAWDGQQEHPEHGRPCVEYYAPTYVVFDAARVSIVEARPAAEAWNLAPEPVAGQADPVLPAAPAPARPRFR